MKTFLFSYFIRQGFDSEPNSIIIAVSYFVSQIIQNRVSNLFYQLAFQNSAKFGEEFESEKSGYQAKTIRKLQKMSKNVKIFTFKD